MPSRLPLERYCGAMTTVIALRSRAKRRPANSRARMAVCTTRREEPRGNEANAAERISEDGAVDADEKWDERRLVDVAPAEVIAASNVIELIAKVAIAVVEIDVKDFGESDGPDDCHAAGKGRRVLMAGSGERRGGCAGHREERITEEGGECQAIRLGKFAL